MLKLIGLLVIQISSYASIAGLYFSLMPIAQGRPAWHWILLGVALLGAVILIYSEVSEFIKSVPKTYRTQKKINSYMCRWVSSGGRVVIFSRDMSWAREEPVRSILKNKARQNELTICVERSISLTNELRDHGAQIVTYQELGHIPRARFTIVDFGRDGARVAVGVHQNGHHVIQEYRNGYHPFFAVAEDLVKFLIAANPGDRHAAQN